MTTTRVTDVRHAESARPGQQEQTVLAANAALDIVHDATAIVMLSFAPKPGGGVIVEVAVAGTGPRGFGETVAGCMRTAGDVVADAMARQETAS